MKKLVIDGHNLVPKIPGLRLSDPDDEDKLVDLLAEYCRLARNRAELFFDAAPPGFATSAKHGLVNVHFVRKGIIADDAILRYLQREGFNSRNLLVVSSDHRVQAEARALGAVVMSSDEFSLQLQHTLANSPPSSDSTAPAPSQAEVEEWLKLMGGKREEN